MLASRSKLLLNGIILSTYIKFCAISVTASDLQEGASEFPHWRVASQIWKFGSEPAHVDPAAAENTALAIASQYVTDRVVTIVLAGWSRKIRGPDYDRRQRYIVVLVVYDREDRDRCGLV